MSQVTGHRSWVRGLQTETCPGGACPRCPALGLGPAGSPGRDGGPGRGRSLRPTTRTHSSGARQSHTRCSQVSGRGRWEGSWGWACGGRALAQEGSAWPQGWGVCPRKTGSELCTPRKPRWQERRGGPGSCAFRCGQSSRTQGGVFASERGPRTAPAGAAAPARESRLPEPGQVRSEEPRALSGED